MSKTEWKRTGQKVVVGIKNHILVWGFLETNGVSIRLVKKAGNPA